MFHWCFIGTGALANIVAKQLLKSGRHDIVSCYSRNEGKRNAFATKYHCKAYADPVIAMNDEGVDAVYVVTPHNVHFDFASIALRNKKPVLVEKPFTVTIAEAKTLLQLAKENDTFMAEAMWTWYSGASLMVKKWIDEGKIGKIQSVIFNYHFRAIGIGSRLFDPKRAGGAMLDIGVYPIAYMYHLFGMPEKVECHDVVWKNGVDLKDDISFSYDDGKKINISVSIKDFHHGEKMKIIGGEGEIIVPSFHHANSAKIKRNGKSENYRVSPDRYISYIPEFDAVMNCVMEGKKESPFVSYQDTLSVMTLVDRTLKKMGLVYPSLEK